MASVGGLTLECAICSLLTEDFKSLRALTDTLTFVAWISCFRRVFFAQISCHMLTRLLVPDNIANIQWWRLYLRNIGRILLFIRFLVQVLLFNGLATLTHDGRLLRVEVKPLFHDLSHVVYTVVRILKYLRMSLFFLLAA